MAMAASERAKNVDDDAWSITSTLVPSLRRSEHSNDDTWSTTSTIVPATNGKANVNAAASSSQPLSQGRSSLEFFFYKGNSVTSKPKIKSQDGTEFRLATSSRTSKTPTITLRQGKEETDIIDILTFLLTYNDFQMHLGPNASIGENATSQLIHVSARIGNPNPSSYTFKLPATSTSAARSLMWSRITGDKNVTTGYRLLETPYNTVVASWSIVSGQKHQAVLRWHAPPSDHLEIRVVLLSFIGSLTRLRIKGMDPLVDWPTLKNLVMAELAGRSMT